MCLCVGFMNVLGYSGVSLLFLCISDEDGRWRVISLTVRPPGQILLARF